MGEIEVLPILREGSQSQSGLLFALPAQFAMMRTCGAAKVPGLIEGEIWQF
jgi:hypothetical protein